MRHITLDNPLAWPEVAAIARREGRLALSSSARARISAAAGLVSAIVAQDIRAYGINTGVGALSDTVIPKHRQAALSRNILMSHAVGIGAPLKAEETRAIMAAAVNNFALGYSGLTPALVERLVVLLESDCLPEVPRQGSVGYLSHMAHIGLVLIGCGHAVLGGHRLSGSDALARLGLSPLSLSAKDGLSLVNGTPCATGLASLALARAERLMDWADAIASMSFESQRCQRAAIFSPAVTLRVSPGLATVVHRLRDYLSDSVILDAAAGRRTQDALSLRAIPQVHGAVRDSWSAVGRLVDQELQSVTDNPVVTGTIEAPEVHSLAHAVGAGVGLAMDQLGIALAELASISERRLDRLVNPLVSGLPAFLAGGAGETSGFMIAQYAAASLVAENRRLATPASLGGGITSGLQEDILCHATPAALKALEVIENLGAILAIEYLAACQSYDLMAPERPAPKLLMLHRRLRATIAPYEDDRPLADDIAAAINLMESTSPAAILCEERADLSA